MSTQLDAALFQVESVHHIHADQCLCGFKSSVSRDRTKHIMDVTLAAAVSLVAELIDSGDCWFDHHGGCQEHGYLCLQPGETCPQQDAKALVARYAEVAK